MESETPGNPLEAPTPIAQGYKEFLKRKAKEFLDKPEFSGVKQWFESRLAALPEMTVTKTPVTDGKNWTREMTPNGEVLRIKSSFFNFEGEFIDSGLKKADGTPITWNQGAIIQSESPVTIPTPEGTMQMKASGFVGLIRDEDGKVLLAVGQEPLAKTEKKALIRTPFQTSAAKLQGILDGNRELDPGLADTLEVISGGKSPFEMFASGEAELFPLPLADGNRIDATNIGFSITVKDKAVIEKLTADGKNRWCTLEEARALTKAGLVNGHTAAALFSESPQTPRVISSVVA